MKTGKLFWVRNSYNFFYFSFENVRQDSPYFATFDIDIALPESQIKFLRAFESKHWIYSPVNKQILIQWFSYFVVIQKLLTVLEILPIFIL